MKITPLKYNQISYSTPQFDNKDKVAFSANKKALGAMTPQKLKAAAIRMNERISGKHYISAAFKKDYEILARMKKRLRKITGDSNDNNCPIEKAMEDYRKRCIAHG